ncbi:MAG: hypothetical protein Q8P00_02925 [Dehalococcoidia bacterium]|nr:hypothetical protein [Dehalococcoidia bacterium]
MLRFARNDKLNHLIILLLVVSLALLFSTPAAAQDGGPTGMISGEMVNLTKGGGSVAGQTITLKTSLKDTETGQSTAKTDASGKFEFKGLATSKDYSYAANLTYQGAEYNSDPITFSPGEQTKPLKMEVYDAIASDEGVRIMASHTIFRPDVKNTMQVTEVFIINNDTDKTFIGTGPALIGSQKKTLSFSVPKGATGFQYGGSLMDCCVVLLDGGLLDTMPIMPGTKEIMFSYQVKHKSEYDFAKSFSLPIERYDIVVQGEGVTVQSDLLQQGETLTIENLPYSHFVAENLKRGAAVTGTFTNMPGSPGGNPIPAVLFVAALAAGLAVAYPLWRRRRLAPVAAAAGQRRSPKDRRQGLLVEIADLDDDFERGAIPEKDYRQRREEKKRLLAGLMPKGKPKP